MRRVNAYPDPFSSRISVEIASEESETCIVTLANSSEKIIRMFSWPLKPGTNKTTIEELSAADPGTYTISIKDSTGKILNRMDLQKATAGK